MSQAAPARTGTVIALVGLAVVGALLFARLGQYALWDDEANTGIFAAGRSRG